MNKKSLSKTGSKNPMYGKIPWNKGLHIRTNTGKTHFRKGQISLEKHPMWKGGKPKCINCNKKLSSYDYKRCKNCFYIYFRGENHCNWKGGISKNVHSTKEPKYKEWRMKVFERDNFRCKLFSKECKGQLQAHHIFKWANYPDLRYVVNNGITLCVAHHPRKIAEEKRMIPIFMELLSVSSVFY